MAAAPIPPSDYEGSWELFKWLGTAIFGGGVAWGAAKMTQSEHGRRITALEDGHKSILAKIDERFDKLNDFLIKIALHRQE